MLQEGVDNYCNRMTKTCNIIKHLLKIACVHCIFYQNCECNGTMWYQNNVPATLILFCGLLIYSQSIVLQLCTSGAAHAQSSAIGVC